MIMIAEVHGRVISHHDNVHLVGPLTAVRGAYVACKRMFTPYWLAGKLDVTTHPRHEYMIALEYRLDEIEILSGPARRARSEVRSNRRKMWFAPDQNFAYTAMLRYRSDGKCSFERKRTRKKLERSKSI